MRDKIDLVRNSCENNTVVEYRQKEKQSGFLSGSISYRQLICPASTFVQIEIIQI